MAKGWRINLNVSFHLTHIEGTDGIVQEGGVIAEQYRLATSKLDTGVSAHARERSMIDALCLEEEF